MNLRELQEIVRDKEAFGALDTYCKTCLSFLELLQGIKPTRIISPTDHNYIFFQFGKDFGHKITRPLNTGRFIEKPRQFEKAFDQFMSLLDDLRRKESKAADMPQYREFISSGGINGVVYTVQQSIGSIGDSFENANQSRKRIGQIFEQLILLLIKELGLECESRTIQIPLPNHPGYSMSYELDLVFSRGKAIVAAENSLIKPNEVVGSVKTTSKDRIDKVFLDKFLMSRLLGRQVPVIAIFLHDVQRAKKGGSIFGINSTFKSNHFLGYTLALNRLDGVYYVDPRPDMVANEHLAKEISDFQRFLLYDLWTLTDHRPIIDNL